MTVINGVPMAFVSKRAVQAIQPAGLHFKQSPLKAFINANFYKPNSHTLDRFVTIKNNGNSELFEKINPFKSLIANYAKANSIRVNFSLTKNNKDLDVVTMKFISINRIGNVGCPFGLTGTTFNSNATKRKAMDEVHDLLAVAAEPKSEGTPLFIEDKFNKIDIAPKNSKHGLLI